MVFKQICAKNSFCFLVLIVFLQFFFIVSASYGQEIQRQSDSIWIDDDYFIQREFQFRKSRNDTLFHGRHSLTMKPFLQDTIFALPYNFEHLEVVFNNNVKQGFFLKKSISFYPDISRFDPEGEYLKIPYRGSRTEVRGQFEDDNPSGQWLFSQIQQNSTEGGDTLLVLNASFNSEGRLEEQFWINDHQEQQVISGSFNNEGGLSDTLYVRNSDEREIVASYYFEDGLLMGISIPGRESIQPAYMDGSEEFNFQEQPLDSLYPKILSYYLQGIPGGETASLLQPLQTVFRSFKAFSAGNSRLANYLPGEYNIPPPRVKLPLYEPESREEELIKETYNRLSLLYDQTDSLLNLPAFSLNRYVDQDLAALYAKGNLLRERVKGHQEVFKILSGPLLEHINPEWFLERRLAEINQQDTVEYTFNDTQHQEQIDFSFESEGLPPYEQYQSYLSRLEELYTEINQQSISSMSRLTLDTRLEEGEERIAALSAEIENLADTLVLNLYNQEISNAFKQAFVDFKEYQLSQYAGLDASVRMSQAEDLINCLEKMKSKLENADQLVLKEALVDQSYMESRLNPYTYTEMNVRMYDRLFNAYQNILIPYLVENIRPAGTCESFLQSVDNLETLQDFMLEALEGNPGRLDRRARNQNNPETIIRRLGIPIVLK